MNRFWDSILKHPQERVFPPVKWVYLARNRFPQSQIHQHKRSCEFADVMRFSSSKTMARPNLFPTIDFLAGMALAFQCCASGERPAATGARCDYENTGK
jgi:hypothetical protein